jgi:hypothetical protein
MSNPSHPKCGKSFPGGSSAGHCSACCETFIGLNSFEAHRVGAHGVDRRCELSEKHWADERGFWHHGPKMSDEVKAARFGEDA